MKKYLLGFIAIVMAVSFSAFTHAGKKQISSDPDLFWYYYDPVNDELQGEISVSRITHEDAMEATLCPDTFVSTIECARGYDEEQDPYDEEPGLGEDRVKKPPVE